MTNPLFPASKIVISGAVSYQLTRFYDKSSNPFMTAALVTIPIIIEELVSNFVWTDQDIKNRNSSLQLRFFRPTFTHMLPFFIFQHIGERYHWGTPSLISAHGIRSLSLIATYVSLTVVEVCAAAFSNDPKKKTNS